MRSRSRLWLGASLLLPLLLLGAGLWVEFGGVVEKRRGEERRWAGEVLASVRERWEGELAGALAAAQKAGRGIRVDPRGVPLGPFERAGRWRAVLRRKLSAAGRIGLEMEGRGRPEEALRFLELGIKSSSDSRLLLAKARCLAQLRRGGEARRVLSALMKRKLMKRKEEREPGFVLPASLRAAVLAGHLFAEAGNWKEVAALQEEFYGLRLPLPVEVAEVGDRFFASLAPLKRGLEDSSEPRPERSRFLALVAAWRLVAKHGLPKHELILPGGNLLGETQEGILPVLTRDEAWGFLQGCLARSPKDWSFRVLGPDLPPEAPRTGPRGTPILARLSLAPFSWELLARPRTLLGSRVLQATGRGLILLGILSFLMGNLLVWRMLRRELELSRLRSDFIDLISHELRTPLAALSLKAEMLAQGEVRPERVRGYQQSLKAEVDRLAILVEEILDFARLEKGRAVIEFRPISPRALLARGLGEARGGLRLGRHRVRVRAPRDLPRLRGDPDLLARALRNLLENAGKYAPPGSEIELRMERCEQGLRLSVRDQGPGVPGKERERIFEPFIRGASAAGKPGSGLGLALVRQAAQAHGGKVWVEEVSPRGACFSLLLPIEEVA